MPFDDQWRGERLRVYADRSAISNGTVLLRVGDQWVPSTIATMLSNLLTTRGDILRYGASAPERYALGASGSLLRSDGTDAVWATVATALSSLLTARGQIIRRGASAPEALAAQTADTFLGGDGTDVTTRTAAQVLTSLNILQSTYTPTTTNVANVAASSALTAVYGRIATFVVVAGYVEIDPTAAASTLTQMGLTIPVSSNFGGTTDLSGVAISYQNRTAAIQADATNDRAQFEFESTSTANTAYRYIFAYRVI